MTARLAYRIAAAIFVLFALGHTVGFLTLKPPSVEASAVRAAMDWAAHGWARRFIVSGHFADNEASGRVLVKAGFLYTGEIRWRFSLARGEAAATRMMVWLA